MSVGARDTNLTQHKLEALVVTLTLRALAFYPTLRCLQLTSTVTLLPTVIVTSLFASTMTVLPPPPWPALIWVFTFMLHSPRCLQLTVMVTVLPTVISTVLFAVTSTVLPPPPWPALTWVFTFMPHPPYRVTCLCYLFPSSCFHPTGNIVIAKLVQSEV